MASIQARYLGLDMPSPVIAAASPMTATVEGMLKAQEAGAGAVVVKSVFEEQIEASLKSDIEMNEEYLNFSSATGEYERALRDHLIGGYASLVKEAKKALSIPVIASICCKSLKSWTMYAERVAEAGADAIELNYYPITSDSSVKGAEVDKSFDAFVAASRAAISLPLSLKIGSRYSGLAERVKSLDRAGIDGVVLFQKAWTPDIDIEGVKIVPGGLGSFSSGYGETLRWVALMSGEVRMDTAASGGIARGKEAVKMILAGASAVEIASVVIREGYSAISEMNSFISDWMDRKGYESIASFKGILAEESGSADGYMWERSQFMKSSGIK